MYRFEIFDRNVWVSAPDGNGWWEIDYTPIRDRETYEWITHNTLHEAIHYMGSFTDLNDPWRIIDLTNKSVIISSDHDGFNAKVNA